MNKEQYLLVCLMEELSEAAQEASKCIRFTLDHQYEEYDKTNKEKLKRELADVQAILIMLSSECNVRLNCDMKSHIRDKINKTTARMILSKDMGVLNDSTD
jgi:NTP pyrophosphatase (non-canonical NTP hydrolase)